MNFSALLTIVACLFLLLATGYIARKFGIINDVFSKGLSRLIITIGQPMLIINSLIRTAYNKEALAGGLRILALGVGLHVFMAAYAYLTCRPIRDLDERKLSEFALVFTNCGFIGFPILETVLGPQALFWGAFFLISFHVTIWTWGILILARGRDDIRPNWRKILINYGTVPCAIGLLLYLSRLPIPDFVITYTGYLGSLCTPVSMLITGALLATIPAKKLFCSGRLYLVCAQKLIVIPLLVCLLLRLLGFSPDIIIFATIIAGLPTAAMITMFGELYDIKPSYAALTVGMTSLLSVFTLPCVMLITQKIVG